MSDFKAGEVLVPNSRFIPQCDCDAEPEVKHTVTRWGASRVIKLEVECSRCGEIFEQQLAHGVEGIEPGNPHAAE